MHANAVLQEVGPRVKGGGRTVFFRSVAEAVGGRNLVYPGGKGSRTGMVRTYVYRYSSCPSTVTQCLLATITKN